MTNEQHASRGKVSKSAVAVAIVGALMAGSASAAYQETAKLGDVESWKTAEYQQDWGLEAMHAADAYALGFNGSGAIVAVTDSGALLQDHPELAGDRFHAVETPDGTFAGSNNRYIPGMDQFHNGAYNKDEHFTDPYNREGSDVVKHGGHVDKITGQYIPYVNDTHGTHVTGTVAANRDGSHFHGVAWGAIVHEGNSGGTDNNNYGPFQDYNYCFNTWNAVAQTGTKIINNSWGTNARILMAPPEDTPEKIADEKAKMEKNPDYKPMTEAKVSLPVNNERESEYEYFLFKKTYGDNKNFVDGAWDAIKDTDQKTVQVFTTGNRNFHNPYYRPLYPYYNPEAEKQWIAVAGLQKNEDGTYQWVDDFNEAGDGKWWTIAGPGYDIYSSIVYDDHYENTSDEHPIGTPGYATYSGTSMAAPHVTGAFGVLASRYQDMNGSQVRDVLFTTATHTNPDGTTMKGWHEHDVNSPIADQFDKNFVPDELYGWGVPDLQAGMYGPKQFLNNTFEYALGEKQKLDVWSNDINQIAHDARLAEDKAWLDERYEGDQIKKKYTEAGSFNLGDKMMLQELYWHQGRISKNWYALEGNKTVEGAFKLAVDMDVLEKLDFKTLEDFQKVSLEDANKWRKEYWDARKAAIEARAQNKDLGLIKDGVGTLVMTGTNTYRGETTVKGGTLLAFAQSVGAKDAETERTVTAKSGATVGILNSYNDNQLTMKGVINADTSYNDKLNVVLENGSSLYVSAGSDVKVKSIDAQGANTIKIGFAGMSDEALVAAYKGDGTLTATVEGLDLDKFVDAAADAPAPAVLAAVAAPADKTVKAEVVNDLGEDAMISTEAKTAEVTAKDGKATATVKTTMKKVEDQAKTANQKAIAASLDGSALATMLRSSGAGVAAAMEALDDDFYGAARNATAVNALVYNRDIRDAAFGYGASRAAELDNGQARLWVAGSKHTGTADSLIDDMDTNFTAGTVGVEYLVNDQHKVGAFIGTGVTKFENERGNIHSDDLHAGVYGLSDVADFSVLYGVSMDRQDRDVEHIYNGATNKHSEKADVAQLFTEVAYNGLKTADVTVTPYAGLSWMRINTKAFSEGEVNFDKQKDDLGVVTVGARAALPFNLGTLPMSVKADAGYSHFVGDTESVTKIQVGSASNFAEINGKELKGQFNLGLGVNAYVGKNVTVGISYSGAVASKADTHGVNATLRVNF